MMSDLIERKTALYGLNYEIKYGAEIDRCGLDTAYDIIENIPSAEPEMINIEELSNELGCATIQSALYWFDFLETLDLLGFAIIRKKTK